MFLVDPCDGKPPGQYTRPSRLIVPDDGRPARGRQIESITGLSP